ncbi:hypothetical protein [Allocoleopsis franciscana]|uniref:hypothetical protein n=1 Tax=Allocoleopsis franciscana TaxID=2886352 RepID=UPI001C0FBA0A|nr:hypothetical protein [Allocoleopsis franciscana]
MSWHSYVKAVKAKAIAHSAAPEADAVSHIAMTLPSPSVNVPTALSRSVETARVFG